jgi:hypothetical protein
MKVRIFQRFYCFIFAISLLLGFLPQSAASHDSYQHATVETTARGTVLFNGEYEFTPPPAPWEMFKGNQTTHYVVAFFRKDPGVNQLDSSFFAYDEEPYGFSGNLEVRAQECLKRYFWSSILQITVLEKKKVKVLGGEGLSVTIEGKDAVKKVKVKSKLVFGKRGERVVAFYVNQWRYLEGSYDSNAFDLFDIFVNSFTFLKKSFYETL